MVLMGLQSARKRSTEARRLLNWAYYSFKNYTLFERGAVVEQAGVWLGEEDTVPLVTEGDIKISLPRASRRGLKVKVVYEGPVPAPIEEGARIAKLVIAAPEFETVEFPLVAGADVGRLGAIRPSGCMDRPHGMGFGAVAASPRPVRKPRVEHPGGYLDDQPRLYLDRGDRAAGTVFDTFKAYSLPE